MEHNGDIEVTSPGLGQGSTFSIRLPIENSPNSLKAGQTTLVELKGNQTGVAKD